jgi:hypothetical protein
VRTAVSVVEPLGEARVLAHRHLLDLLKDARDFG